MRNTSIPFLLLVVALLLPNYLPAVELNGTVIDATTDTVKIAIASELVPNVGDKVTIFFKVPGLDDDVLVGIATVTEIGAEFVQAQIESATGEVVRDYLVKIVSENPTQRIATPDVPNDLGNTGEVRLKAAEDRLKAAEEARLKAEEEAQHKAAEEARLKAEEEARRMAQLSFQQGLTFAAMGRIDKSIQEFSAAIERDPTYAFAYANRGVAYITQKKYNKALDDLKKAVDLNPKDYNAFYNLAALYTLRREFDPAIDALDKALTLGFNNYNALRRDPDLAGLRKQPELRKLLERHKISR